MNTGHLRLLIIGLLAVASTCWAQEFPARSLRFVVGQPVVAEHGPRVESLLSDDIAYWQAAARDAKLKVE